VKTILAPDPTKIEPWKSRNGSAHIKLFSEIGIEDIPEVGGKTASLGEMFRQLGSRLKISDGFAITAEAYRYFLRQGGLEKRIDEMLRELDVAQFLVEQKIDSISLNPDTVLKTTIAILEKEQ